MDISIIIISILGIAVVILGFTTWNLLSKTEKQEDIIINYDNFINEYSKQLDVADKRIGRAHVWTPVTATSRMPSSAWKKKTERKSEKKMKKEKERKKNKTLLEE